MAVDGFVTFFVHLRIRVGDVARVSRELVPRRRGIRRRGCPAPQRAHCGHCDRRPSSAERTHAVRPRGINRRVPHAWISLGRRVFEHEGDHDGASPWLKRVLAFDAGCSLATAHCLKTTCFRCAAKMGVPPDLRKLCERSGHVGSMASFSHGYLAPTLRELERVVSQVASRTCAPDHTLRQGGPVLGLVDSKPVEETQGMCFALQRSGLALEIAHVLDYDIDETHDLCVGSLLAFLGRLRCWASEGHCAAARGGRPCFAGKVRRVASSRNASPAPWVSPYRVAWLPAGSKAFVGAVSFEHTWR